MTTSRTLVMIATFFCGAAWLWTWPMAASAQSASDDETAPLKVFLFAGQSNMAGSGKSEELPADLQAASDQVLVLDDPERPTKWKSFQPSGRIGPEVSFCKDMAEALGEPVGMIKVAVGGSNLAIQWDPDGEDNLYARFRNRVRAAQELDHPIEIVGMLWMQGERDSRFEEMADAYEENLANLVKSVRNDVQNEELIFVCGRVNPHFPPGTVPESAPENYRFVFKVREAQEGLSLPRVGWVDCDALAKNRDVLHYNTDGLIEMGRLMAEKMHQLMQDE